MTKCQKGKQTIDHVVGYCKVREAIATARTDRYMKLHWQSVGLVVMEAFYGADSPRPRFSESARGEYVPKLKPMTTSQLEMLRQPLQRVVKQVMVGTLDNHLGRVLRAYEDVLACGHRLPVLVGPYEGDSVRHRRCSKCPPLTQDRRALRYRKAS